VVCRDYEACALGSNLAAETVSSERWLTRAHDARINFGVRELAPALGVKLYPLFVYFVGSSHLKFSTSIRSLPDSSDWVYKKVLRSGDTVSPQEGLPLMGAIVRTEPVERSLNRM